MMSSDWRMTAWQLARSARRMFRYTGKAPVLLALVALSASSASHSASASDLPRVVSINLCTDQLLMLLAEPEQILALSSLSRDPAGSYQHKSAHDFPQVAPIAEDLLPLNPDLVVTGTFTSRYTLSLLDELKIRVETLPIANSIGEVLDNVRLMGELLGQQTRAADLVEDMQRRLTLIAEHVEQSGDQAQPRIAAYDANGYTAGRQTLRGDIIALAGWSNAASAVGIESYGVLGLEQLVSLDPHALMESPYSVDTYSRGQMLAAHPAIRAAGIDPLIFQVPSNEIICPGPWTVDVLERLIELRSTL